MQEIHVYGASANGTQAAAFRIGRIEVRVSSYDADDNGEVKEIAESLSDHAKALEKRDADAEKARKHAELLAAEIRILQGRVPPPAPIRMLGPGFVRFTASGELWLLGKREGGFAAFGFRCESWDDLFRRYDVRVTEHGTDEHGPWWKVDAGRAALAAYEAGK